MGGMGKTTIADAIFHLVSHQFEKTHFALCVRAESEKDSSGLFRLRDKIISKVLNEKIKIDSLSIPQSIKRRLNQKKVLIVLDDVDKLVNFEILAGGLDQFGRGSRIILTTRDKQVLHNCGVEDHYMFKVEELNDDEALQLFYKKAFKPNHPTKDFEVLSRKVAKIAGNVPLAVRVLGSLLLNKKSKQDWESAIDKFQRNVNPDVFAVLRVSYDGLDEEEKGLFLDIACFVGFEINGEYLKANLSSDREFSLSGLIDKSLVTVEHGCIKMHDLLREMGREIVDKESPNKLGDRSRLWRQEDVFHMLKHNDGVTNAVQGILLDLYHIGDERLVLQAFEKMYHLRTLIIEGSVTIGGIDFLHDELRYLHWNFYPLKVLPSSFNPVNLVELDLSYSKIKQLWEGKTYVPKLKRLELFESKNLIRIPDLSDIPSAESINLENCISLREIHSSTECPKLKRLNLYGCKNLIRIPDLSDIPSAESINLENCLSLREIHSSTECPKLKRLNLYGCKNLIRIPDLSDIPSVESINLGNFISLREIHTSTECPKLKRLDLYGCKNLIRIPNLSDIPSAESIDLSNCISLREIHSSTECPKLQLLNLFGCENLIRIPDLSDIPSVESIDLGNCISLHKIHSSTECPKLKWLNLYDCKNLIRIPDLSDIPSAESIDLGHCISLREIHSSIECSKLKLLNLYGCKNLIRIPNLSDIPSVKSIDLSNCINLHEIHSSTECPKLQLLNLYGCKNLIRIPDLSDIPSAESINLKFCSSLLEIHSSRECPKLKQLDLSCCENLIRIPDLSDIPSAESIDLSNCKNLERLPKSIKKLSKLHSLKLNHCGMLRSLPELPSSLQNLEAINCKQLIQSLPDESEFEHCTDGSVSLYFNFINCLKMNQEAVSNLLIFFRESLLKMQRMGTEKIISFFERDEQKEVEGSICLPGSEIPEWFSCYKNNGYSINIPGLRNDCGRSSYIMGFAVCLVIGFENYYADLLRFRVRYNFDIETSDGQKERFSNQFPLFCMPSKDEFSYSDHIFLGYNLSCECYELFQKLDTLLANRGMSDDVSISFKFIYGRDWHVKCCGIQPIYVPAQVMNYVVIDQDIGDTSGCKDTAEETCEPHPKRICTETNQCS